MKKLAIIGANYLQLPLVKKANELGFETHCFAYLEGAVCKEHCHSFYEISIVDKEEILEICKSLNISGVLSIASDLAVITVNYVAFHLNLIGNTISSSDLTTNKFMMKEALAKANIPIAKFDVGKQVSDFDLTKFDTPIIIKPSDRSGSFGVSIISKLNEFSKAFSTAHQASFNKNVIIEEYIEGVELSAETLSFNGNHQILATTDKTTTGPPNFVELEHHQPAVVTQHTIDQIKSIIPQALNTLEIKHGASHIELFVTKNGKVIINEIGARMGGDFIGSHLVELSTGYDYLKAVIDIALGRKPEVFNPIQQYSGVIFRNKSNKDRFDLVLKSDKSTIELESNLNDSDILTKSGDRGNYLIYKANKKMIL